MDRKILDCLNSHSVCSLTTILSDGSPHAAALHYSHSDDPLTMFFSTDSTSRKCKGLLNGETVKGAVVVGFSEEEWVTLQMDGEVRVIDDQNRLKKIQKVHYSKHPNSEKFKNDPNTIFLEFIPSWWRYTDYYTKPATFIESDQKGV